jgi:hypothetical protein
MVTSAIIPGRSVTSLSESTMRTGRRWVILVKLPLGFGSGSSANLLVAA